MKDYANNKLFDDGGMAWQFSEWWSSVGKNIKPLPYDNQQRFMAQVAASAWAAAAEHYIKILNAGMLQKVKNN